MQVIDEILYQAAEKVDKLIEAYAEKYLTSGSLEPDIRGMIEEKKDISVQEVNNLISSNLENQISELAEFKKIIADVTLDLTNKQPESSEYKYFSQYYKNHINFLLSNYSSVRSRLVFEKIVQQN